MAGPELAASSLVAALERTWEAIRVRHPEVPEVVLVVAAGSDRRARQGLKLGHFAVSRWRAGRVDRHEVLVSGEGLRRNAREVLGTLLHEAAHGLAQVRGINDTSREGRYHNRRYRTLAAELGLNVAQVAPIGWSATTVRDDTAADYAAVLDQLAAAMRLWRKAEHPANGTRSRNLLACTCRCDRRIRVSRRTLDQAPILCTACAQPFTPQSDDA